jgi:hypothetical protein
MTHEGALKTGDIIQSTRDAAGQDVVAIAVVLPGDQLSSLVARYCEAYEREKTGRPPIGWHEAVSGLFAEHIDILHLFLPGSYAEAPVEG